MMTLSILLALSPSAFAVDADPFDPSGSFVHGRGTLQAEAPQLNGAGLSLGLLANAAEDLAVFEYGNGDQVVALSQVVGSTLYGGYTIESLGRVELFIPVYLVADAPLAPYRGLGMGDVRVQGLFPVYSQGDTLEVAVVPELTLPTGSKKSLLYRGTSAAVHAAVGGYFDAIGYTVNLGFTLSRSEALGPVQMGSTAEIVGGGWYQINENTRVGAEVEFVQGLVSGDLTANAYATSHLFAQTISQSGLGLSVGLGKGLFAGVGEPQYRLFAGVTYGPPPGEADSDEDGIPDSSDACMLKAEDIDGFEDEDGCPDLDNDADGVPDVDDKCVNEPEDIDEFDDLDGCPDVDNDLDSVLDVDDLCPILAGSVENGGCPDQDGDGLPDNKDGCPMDVGPVEFGGCPDADADGVPDPDDLCPNEPKAVDEDVRVSDGCPKSVYLSPEKVVFEAPALFASGRALLLEESYEQLNAVVSLLKNTPRVKQIEIGIHTDNQGGEGQLMQISQRQADAFMAYLTEHGVAASRVVAKGYGPSQPIGSNRTSSGRAKNRRVELLILKQDPLPELAKPESNSSELLSPEATTERAPLLDVPAGDAPVEAETTE